MIERKELIVLGRLIGLTSGWNEGDAGELQFLDFSPVDELRHILGDCSALDCDFNRGVFTGYDEDGDITYRCDMMVIASISRVEDVSTVFAHKQELVSQSDPILDAIAEAGLTVAFDLKPGASQAEIDSARKVVDAIARASEWPESPKPWPTGVYRDGQGSR